MIMNMELNSGKSIKKDNSYYRSVFLIPHRMKNNGFPFTKTALICVVPRQLLNILSLPKNTLKHLGLKYKNCNTVTFKILSI